MADTMLLKYNKNNYIANIWNFVRDDYKMTIILYKYDFIWY